MKLERVWHEWTEWEEIGANMWGPPANRMGQIAEAVKFTGNHSLYGSFMVRVIEEWPISCENALTDYGHNRKAWIGHAAVAFALQIPESITRIAWGELTHEQQFLANEEARKAIQAWENAYIEDKGLRQDVGGSLLL